MPRLDLLKPLRVPVGHRQTPFHRKTRRGGRPSGGEGPRGAESLCQRPPGGSLGIPRNAPIVAAPSARESQAAMSCRHRQSGA